MKAFLCLSALVAFSSAATLTPRQFGAAATLYKIEQVKPQVRSDAKRQIAYFGPYTLRANEEGDKPVSSHSHGTMGGSAGGKSGGGGLLGSLGGLGGMMMEDANAQNMVITMSSGFPKDATVLAGKVGLAFEDLSEADETKGVYIHHVITQDMSKKTSPFVTFCDSKVPATGAGFSDRLMAGLGAGFIGTGDDNKNMQTYYTTPDGKYDAGFHLGKKDNFLANVMVVNYNKEAKKVYLTYEIEYLPGIVGADTQTSLLTVTGCLARPIALSKTAATNTTSDKFTFLQSGNILSAKGHIHDGGEAMHLYINDKYTCSSRATYGSAIAGGKTATITGMSQCAGPIPVRKGDYMTMISEYNLPAHPLRESTSGTEAGTMGMWRVLFAAT